MKPLNILVLILLACAALLAGCSQRKGTSVTELVVSPSTQAVELSAYTWLRWDERNPKTPLLVPNYQGCFDLDEQAVVLVDRPVPQVLPFLGGGFVNRENNFAQSSVPWLLPVWPEPLPYRALYSGHLGDPRYAHCPFAERIFVIDAVLQVELLDYPFIVTPASPVTVPADYGQWSSYADSALGYRFAYPQDWRLSNQASGKTIQLTSARWPEALVEVTPHQGVLVYDRYEPANTSPMLTRGNILGFWYLDNIPVKGDLQRQHLFVYMTTIQFLTNPSRSQFLVEADGFFLEVTLQYPIGLTADQGVMDILSTVLLSFRVDRQPGPTATIPLKQTVKRERTITQQ